MALQTTGPISLVDIATEFGGTIPHSLSEYYRGGGRVPDATQNANISTSGSISLNNFYGATNRITVNIILSANETNYLLNTSKATGYTAGITDVIVTINSGVYISSNSTTTPALDIDTSWASGDTIQINNSGIVVGMGGTGGNGESVTATSFGVYYTGITAGGSGGPALRAQRSVSINNLGTIAGGGGGGGGGAGEGEASIEAASRNSAAGGGGGGGRTSLTNSSGGLAGTASGGKTGNANPGSAGTYTSAGTGGTTFYSGFASTGYKGGSGGSGGSFGTAGSSGGTSLVLIRSGTSGGSGGAAVIGNSNISWSTTGTRLGAIT